MNPVLSHVTDPAIIAAIRAEVGPEPNRDAHDGVADWLHWADQKIPHLALRNLELQAEVAIYKGRDQAKQLVINQLERERDQLKSCEVDAKRYRFIRDVPWTTRLSRVIGQHRNAYWDSAIDEAMTTQPTNGEQCQHRYIDDGYDMVCAVCGAVQPDQTEGEQSA